MGMATPQLGYSYATGLTEEQVMSKTVLLFSFKSLMFKFKFLKHTL